MKKLLGFESFGKWICLKYIRQHRTIVKSEKIWYNRDMNRQMTLAEMNDELGAARTNKKEFLEKLE
ncbi:MAG: hypothetical protein J6A93_02545, partial [Ruminococcus sp.]|nr:hypothetical protein [Ruminococcus sp.]